MRIHSIIEYHYFEKDDDVFIVIVMLISQLYARITCKEDGTERTLKKQRTFDSLIAHFSGDDDSGDNEVL